MVALSMRRRSVARTSAATSPHGNRSPPSLATSASRSKAKRFSDTMSPAATTSDDEHVSAGCPCAASASTNAAARAASGVISTTTGSPVASFSRSSYASVPSADANADALLADLTRLEAELGEGAGKNIFEGFATVRIYNLLARGKIYEEIPVHDTVLSLVEGAIGKGPLVSSLSSIAIGPGERAQPIHADDQLIPLPKPHVSIICNSMWALTDFTEDN